MAEGLAFLAAFLITGFLAAFLTVFFAAGFRALAAVFFFYILRLDWRVLWPDPNEPTPPMANGAREVRRLYRYLFDS